MFTQNPQLGPAGLVQLAAVELQADDGEHEDGEEKQHADLEQRNHGLHDGLQDDLETWRRRRRRRRRRTRQETHEHVANRWRIIMCDFSRNTRLSAQRRRRISSRLYSLKDCFATVSTDFWSVFKSDGCVVRAFCNLMRDFGGGDCGVSVVLLLTRDA